MLATVFMLAMQLPLTDTTQVAKKVPQDPPSIVTLQEVSGTYIEVINSADGPRRSPRCGPEDQLIIENKEQTLTLRWGVSGSAKIFQHAQIENGRITLRDKRRDIVVQRFSEKILQLSFVRGDGRTRAYLYAPLDYAKSLPIAKEQQGGCKI